MAVGYSSETRYKVGAVLSEQNAIRPAAQECAPPTKELIVQADGGHIPIQNPEQRSFESLSAIVDRPDEYSSGG